MVTFNEPVISVFEFTETVVPLSLIFESPIWSEPTAFGILFVVIPISLPNEPVFCGPEIKRAELYPSPLPEG